MIFNIIRWIAVLVFAFVAGKLMTKIKMPSILGWLIVGMLLGPHAINLMPQSVLDARWYKTIIIWMQRAFGEMLGSELIWSRSVYLCIYRCPCFWKILWSKNRSKTYPYAGYCQEISRTNTFASFRGLLGIHRHYLFHISF